MTAPRKRLWACLAAGGALLLLANLVVAVRHLGTRPGQTYRWVCPASGAELCYTPSVFGGTRFIRGREPHGGGSRWELVEPQPPSPLLPWNWLALALDRPAPDPDDVIRRAGLAADQTPASASQDSHP